MRTPPSTAVVNPNLLHVGWKPQPKSGNAAQLRVLKTPATERRNSVQVSNVSHGPDDARRLGDRVRDEPENLQYLMDDGDIPGPPPEDEYIPGPPPENDYIPPPPPEADFIPPPPEENDVPPPPVKVVSQLQQAADQLALAGEQEQPQRAHHGQRTALQRREARLTAEGNSFLKALKSFKDPGVLNADGEVSNSKLAAKHVVTLARQLEGYRGMRADFSLTRHERLTARAQEGSERHDRIEPGRKAGVFSVKAHASNEPGLPSLPIDALVENTRAEVAAPLEHFIAGINLADLTHDELRQLEGAVTTLGIDLGAKFDAAHGALDRTKAERDRKANAGYVEPQIGDRFEVLSKDITPMPNWTRKPRAALAPSERGSQTPVGTSLTQKLKNFFAALRDAFARKEPNVWQEEPRPAHVDREVATEVPSANVESVSTARLSPQQQKWLDIPSTAGAYPTPSTAKRVWNSLVYKVERFFG